MGIEIKKYKKNEELCDICAKDAEIEISFDGKYILETTIDLCSKDVKKINEIT